VSVREEGWRSRRWSGKSSGVRVGEEGKGEGKWKEGGRVSGGESKSQGPARPAARPRRGAEPQPSHHRKGQEISGGQRGEESEMGPGAIRVRGTAGRRSSLSFPGKKAYGDRMGQSRTYNGQRACLLPLFNGQPLFQGRGVMREFHDYDTSCGTSK